MNRLYLKLFEDVLSTTKKSHINQLQRVVKIFPKESLHVKMGFINDLFQILLINIFHTNLFVDAVHKSFNEVTRSSIREWIKCALNFNPDRQETGTKLLSSILNVVGTLLDNKISLLLKFLDMKYDTNVHYKKKCIVNTSCWGSDSLPWLPQSSFL